MERFYTESLERDEFFLDTKHETCMKSDIGMCSLP